MKVLFITRKYPPSCGGMENLSYELTKGFSGEKKIIALRRKNQISLVWFIPYTLFYILIQGGKYDLVHIGDLVLIGLGYFVKLFHKKTKVIINAHGLDITYLWPRSFFSRIYKGYCLFFKKKKSFDLIICISNATEKLAKDFQLGPSMVINPGFRIFSDKKYQKNDLWRVIGKSYPDSKILLTVGRLVKRKGVSWFLENVFPNLPDNVIYLVVGEKNWNDTKNIEAKNIKKIIIEKKLDKRIIILGEISNENLAILYQTVDMLVMPNIPKEGDFEGFGLVALEAAAKGLPVVAADIEGISDAIKHQQNGFLVKAKDERAFSETICSLLNDDLKRKEIGEKARRFTLENYSWDKIIKKYEEVFESLVRN